jgi:hypothetical protein
LSHPSKIIFKTFNGGSGGADFGQAGFIDSGTATPVWATTKRGLQLGGGVKDAIDGIAK